MRNFLSLGCFALLLIIETRTVFADDELEEIHASGDEMDETHTVLSGVGKKPAPRRTTPDIDEETDGYPVGKSLGWGMLNPHIHEEPQFW
ncbi:unnamed protein product [Dicrocoelium dendriticum]|nr:unnamed protein product [Dicrocoelium dendriticum]